MTGIVDYATLQSAVSAWMLRSTSDAVVTAAQVKTYIQLAEAELNRELRIRELEADVALPTVTAQDYVTLPSDFKRISSFEYDDNSANLDQIGTRQELKRKWGNSEEQPLEYAIFGSKIFMGPTPDAIYTTHLYYFTAIPALSDGNATNAILTAYPDAYLYGAVRQGCMQISSKDKKADAENNYGTVIKRIQEADMNSRISSNARMKTRRRLV
jgi:hypothetical protein